MPFNICKNFKTFNESLKFVATSYVLTEQQKSLIKAHLLCLIFKICPKTNILLAYEM